MKRRFAAVLLALVVSSGHAQIAESMLAPDELVRSTAADVLGRLDSNAKDAAAIDRLIVLVEERVAQHFDFPRMTKLAVGKHWRAASQVQQQRLSDEFHKLLVRTYAVALIQFQEYDTEYRPAEYAADGQRAIVRSLVRRAGGGRLNMEYRLIKTPTGWRAYDVMVDGVSLVINYRSFFSATVDASGIEGLITLLANKNAQTRP